MTEMMIGDLIRRKRQMEYDIEKSISKFNMETGTKILSIELTYIDFSFETPPMLSNIKAKLEL